MSLNILAYGANGAQMGAGTQALIDAGHRVRIITRSIHGAEHWQSAGAEVHIGDMSNLADLSTASKGQDAVFLHVPIIRDDEAAGARYGLNALKAAKAAGITKVVWNTGAPIMDAASATEPNAIILRYLQSEGFSFLALSPTLYMENLLGPWTTSQLSVNQLCYPTPSDFNIQWVAAKDFGRIADKAFNGQLRNEVITLGGPSALDGHTLASTIGAALNQTLQFQTLAAKEFQLALEHIAGARVASLVGGMYAGIQAMPAQFQPGFICDASCIERNFGLCLTPLAEWVAEYKSQLLNKP